MYIKGHVETVDTKDQSNAIVYLVWYLVCIKSVDIGITEWFVKACNALNAMFFDTGVCGFYTTLYTEQ